MINLLIGFALTMMTVFLFVYSLPKGGKVARFVGTEWEGYVVVIFVGLFGIGAIFAIIGVAAIVTSS